MDRLEKYRTLIMSHLSSLADLVRAQRPPEQTGVDCECAFDERRDQYLLLKIGWAGGRRVRATTLHVRIRNERIWIEEDMTEEGLAAQLLRDGVPPSDIVLAFQPPSNRRHTEFAVV